MQFIYNFCFHIPFCYGFDFLAEGGGPVSAQPAIQMVPETQNHVTTSGEAAPLWSEQAPLGQDAGGAPPPAYEEPPPPAYNEAPPPAYNDVNVGTTPGYTGYQ